MTPILIISYIALLGWIGFGWTILDRLSKPAPEDIDRLARETLERDEAVRRTAKARLRAAEARNDSRTIHHARKAMEAATTAALRRRAF